MNHALIAKVYKVRSDKKVVIYRPAQNYVKALYSNLLATLEPVVHILIFYSQMTKTYQRLVLNQCGRKFLMLVLSCTRLRSLYIKIRSERYEFLKV